MMKSMKSVYIYSNGCSSNILDGQRLSQYFEINGYELTQDPATADVIVVNTCAFESVSEKDSLEKIQELQNIKCEKMIVCGCLPAINKQKMEDVYSGEYFIPKDEATWSKVDQIIHARVPISEVKDPSVLSVRWKDWKLIGTYKAFRENNECKAISGYDEDAFHLRIATGCASNCSYCAIKFARGSIKSKPIDDILNDFKDGLSKGFKSFKIWADDVGDYGLDINTNIAYLLEEILKIRDDYELEILATNPNRFIELYEILAPCLCDSRVKYLNISIQSGSSKILKLMNREIDLKELLVKVRDLKARAPHLIIRAHYMVGFPHEKLKDFISTLVFTFKARIFKYLVSKYDPKPNTEASQLQHQASPLKKEIYYYSLIFWGKFWSLLLEDGKTY